jgi:hypothetical protein
VVYDTSDNSVRYGELVCVGEESQLKSWNTMRGELPLRGILALQVQAIILDFLVKCCKRLLYDVPALTELGNDHPIQPEPPSLNRHTEYRSIKQEA